jgi:signal transduction histidine kinase
MKALQANRPSSAAAVRRPAPETVLSIRVLLVLGFGTVFLLWLASGFVLVRRMVDADARGAEIRQRFLVNDRLLADISTRTLQTSLALGDAWLDPSAVSGVAAELATSRAEIDKALEQYELRDSSGAEGEAWYQLSGELEAYWGAVLPMVADVGVVRTAAERSSLVASQVMPRRQAIMRILDQIHRLNEIAFREEQAALATLRAGLRRQVWQATAIAVLLGVFVAGLAIRHAGRLERRIVEQHALEAAQRTELERLSQKLMAAQEDERRRIARELHDEVGQALGAIKLELALAERDVRHPLQGRLGEARAMVDGALESVRELSRLVHPMILDDLGLEDATASYLQHFSRRTGIRTALRVANLDKRFASQLEVCAYRIVQEAVNNVGRHAAAASCEVRIERREDALQVTVQDDGSGFTPAEGAERPRSGLGLVGLRERVTDLGGLFEVTSAIGQGTRVSAALPLSVPTP